MDKRFFLALFLSLVVIAVSQLVFPSSRPTPGSRVAPAKDSSSGLRGAASPASVSSSAPNVNPPTTPLVTRTTPVATQAGSRVVAETTTVTTPKVIYKFSNIGAAPVSIVIRDYLNRSASGGIVDLAAEGSPLLGYRLVTPK